MVIIPQQLHRIRSNIDINAIKKIINKKDKTKKKIITM